MNKYVTSLSGLNRKARVKPVTSATSFIARVKEVLLDNISAPGAIKFESIQNNTGQASPIFNIAIPLDASNKKIPLVNELVEIKVIPNLDLGVEAELSSFFYGNVVGIFSAPNNNAAPNPREYNGELDLGNGFQEAADINPLQPFPGDILLEGRQGQSIRFTGAFHPKNPFSTPFNASFPLTIISNGQIPTANGFDPIVEDINKDASSIYLTAGHKVNLIPASTKRTSYTTIPAEPSNYQGSQVLINSDRLYLNASKESILMSSANSIGLSASTLNFDSQGTTIVDGSKIEFGKDATQPILKGNDTVKLLRDLITELQALSTALVKAGGQPNGPFPTLIDAGTSLTKLTATLLTELEPLKSKLTYTK